MSTPKEKAEQYAKERGLPADKNWVRRSQMESVTFLDHEVYEYVCEAYLAGDSDGYRRRYQKEIERADENTKA